MNIVSPRASNIERASTIGRLVTSSGQSCLVYSSSSAPAVPVAAKRTASARADREKARIWFAPLVGFCWRIVTRAALARPHSGCQTPTMSLEFDKTMTEAGRTPAPTPAPGDALAAGTTFAHFAIEKRLGKGGMGEVYLARDTALDRPVALKIIDPDIPEN